MLFFAHLDLFQTNISFRVAGDLVYIKEFHSRARARACEKKKQKKTHECYFVHILYIHTCTGSVSIGGRRVLH